MMTKINQHVGDQLLRTDNTIFASISSKKDVWWLTVDTRKFRRELHVILVKNGDSGLIWLRIAPGSISAPKDVFRFRVKKKNDCVDCEISSHPDDRRYMRDIRSGGTEYDFTRHVEYEWS